MSKKMQRYYRERAVDMGYRPDKAMHKGGDPRVEGLFGKSLDDRSYFPHRFPYDPATDGLPLTDTEVSDPTNGDPDNGNPNNDSGTNTNTDPNNGSGGTNTNSGTNSGSGTNGGGTQAPDPVTTDPVTNGIFKYPSLVQHNELIKRVDANQNKGASNLVKINKNTADIAALETSTTTKFTNLTNSINTKITQVVASINTKLTALNTTLSTTITNLSNSVNTRFTSVDQALAISTNKININTTNVTNVTTRVTALETKTTGLNTSITGLTTDLAGVKTNIATINTDLQAKAQALTTKLGAVETKTKTNATSIQNLNNWTTSVDTAFRTFTSNASIMNSKVRVLTDRIAALEPGFDYNYACGILDAQLQKLTEAENRKELNGGITLDSPVWSQWGSIEQYAVNEYKLKKIINNE